MHEFRFEPVQLPAAAEALRSEVRAFIAEEVAKGGVHAPPQFLVFLRPGLPPHRRGGGHQTRIG